MSTARSGKKNPATKNNPPSAIGGNRRPHSGAGGSNAIQNRSRMNTAGLYPAMPQKWTPMIMNQIAPVASEITPKVPR